MKTISNSLWCVLFLSLLYLQAVAQTKPKIQLKFEIDVASDTFFNELFENGYDEIKTAAKPILIDGLNKYISFLSFVPENSGHELTAVLKRDPLNDGHAEDYILEFTLSGEPQPVRWLFLDNTTFSTMDESVETLLEHLAERWDGYLIGSHNNELVARLFGQVPLSLPDSSHYYVSGSTKEAILPFKNDQLQMRLDDCKFKVRVNGKNDDGVNTHEILDELTYTGFVEDAMTGVPENLKECIRIGLKRLELNQLTNGLVFITYYSRMPIGVENSTPLDFAGSINLE